ncbi:isovaleryl-CoA dehydrogenase [Azoarcus sp. KH32C]|uniref:isovaleryl-CoA dehydrogenase n=1 Tax=Azoarcus sp. KH32C TaxID=748247 RepID=UPI0002386127|nr:isovaleryl-CoA dehydrogenase [Azoarcus sp. KH32C]BAL24049.1 acyl-CoA dehydrogenase [Azoarcus sp. KH32C]
MWQTHEVFNQVPPRTGNFFASDAALQEAVVREGADWHAEALSAQGETLGSAETERLAELANRHVPALVPFDRNGLRIDSVEFHPAWTQLLAMLYADGVHSSAWFEPRAGAHVARAASFYLHGQAEAGTLCPVTMTFASIPVLRRDPALFGMLRDKFGSRDYDPADQPIAGKRSVMIGMGMTEKQGGSDLRGITTQARPTGAGSREFAIVGHKWFFSVPTCDAHLVLAHGGDILSCFFMPRWLPDGRRNAIRIQRLKDKLGNRSNASAEVEFQDAIGFLVGDEGRGIPTIMEMAAQTRLDCVLGSAALMRRALVEAIHHCRHRTAFGRLLADQALMGNVLADLALESEAATALGMRLAKAVESDADPLQRAYKRIVTPAAKFWVCKRAIQLTAECMEAWGGNGYVEDAPMARLYREAPVNSIWEGSGNVMCLDVLRAAAREPDALQALLQDLGQAAGDEPALKDALAELTRLTSAPAEAEWHARHLATQLVLLVQAVLLRRHAPAWVAEEFIVSRLAARRGQVSGLLARPQVATMMLQRALPS